MWLSTMSSDIRGMLGEKRGAEGRWLHSQGWRTNPFTGVENKLSDPRAFTGYKPQLKEVVSNIDDNVNSFVVGEFGVGKSTFVNYVISGLPEDEFKASFVQKPASSVKR